MAERRKRGNRQGNQRPAAEEFMRTDLGNSERLATLHGQNLRHCQQHAKWYCWNGRHWAEDLTRHPERLAKGTVRSIYGEAARTEDETERKQLAMHAAASESSRAIEAMLKLSRSDAQIAMEASVFDRDPMVLNTLSGTLDLRSGQMRKPDRADLITKMAPVSYDPDAKCPRWQQFLAEVFADDSDLVEFMQVSVGYWLTGNVSEHAFWMNHGIGANGKSVFMQTMQAMLGKGYSQEAPAALLLSKRGGSEMTADIARLQGARLAVVGETDQGRRFDEAMLKKLVSSDELAARWLYGQPFEFSPTHKLVLSTNHRPEIRGTDSGIWRRIRLIPWEVSFAPEDQDRHLVGKLREELSGILAWAVEGCVAWQSNGLQAPAKVLAATADYRAEEDVLGNWLEECCVQSSSAFGYSDELLESYEQFSGEHVSSTKFGRLLRDNGFSKDRIGASRKRVWKGLGLTLRASASSESAPAGYPGG